MKTRVNPNSISPMEMNKISSMASMVNLIQKIGKGKRKYSINVDKSDKKLLSRFMNEAKKQFSDVTSGGQNVGLYNFFNYITSLCDKKETSEIKLSYEEYDFLKKMILDSIKGMESMPFFWYQFIRKITAKLMVKQYKSLLEKFK